MWNPFKCFARKGNITKVDPKTFSTDFSMYFRDWDNRKIVGWLDIQPEVGDLLECELKNGLGLFRFIEVRGCLDPADMFFATVEDLGYKGEI